MGTFVLDEMPNNIEKINYLQVHMIIGFVLGLLTLIRIFVKKNHEPLFSTASGGLWYLSVQERTQYFRESTVRIHRYPHCRCHAL